MTFIANDLCKSIPVQIMHLEHAEACLTCLFGVERANWQMNYNPLLKNPRSSAFPQPPGGKPAGGCSGLIPRKMLIPPAVSHPTHIPFQEPVRHKLQEKISNQFRSCCL